MEREWENIDIMWRDGSTSRIYRSDLEVIIDKLQEIAPILEAIHDVELMKNKFVELLNKLDTLNKKDI